MDNSVLDMAIGMMGEEDAPSIATPQPDMTPEKSPVDLAVDLMDNAPFQGRFIEQAYGEGLTGDTAEQRAKELAVAAGHPDSNILRTITGATGRGLMGALGMAGDVGDLFMPGSFNADNTIYTSSDGSKVDLRTNPQDMPWYVKPVAGLREVGKRAGELLPTTAAEESSSIPHYVGGAVNTGVQSLAAMLPAAALAGPTMGAAVGAGLFGLTETDQFINEADKAGIPRSKSVPLAMASGAVEGGLEWVADKMALRFLGGEGVAKLGKEGIKKWFLGNLKNFGVDELTEITTEVLQGKSGDVMRQTAGIDTGGFGLRDAKETAIIAGLAPGTHIALKGAVDLTDKMRGKTQAESKTKDGLPSLPIKDDMLPKGEVTPTEVISPERRAAADADVLRSEIGVTRQIPRGMAEDPRTIQSYDSEYTALEPEAEKPVPEPKQPAEVDYSTDDYALDYDPTLKPEKEPVAPVPEEVDYSLDDATFETVQDAKAAADELEGDHVIAKDEKGWKVKPKITGVASTDLGAKLDSYINDKYGDILGAEGTEPLSADFTLTPRGITEELDKSSNPEETRKNIFAEIADMTGDLIETYKYESPAEARDIERNIDALTDVAKYYKRVKPVEKLVGPNIEETDVKAEGSQPATIISVDEIDTLAADLPSWFIEDMQANGLDENRDRLLAWNDSGRMRGVASDLRDDAKAETDYPDIAAELLAEADLYTTRADEIENSSRVVVSDEWGAGNLSSYQIETIRDAREKVPDLKVTRDVDTVNLTSDKFPDIISVNFDGNVSRGKNKVPLSSLPLDQESSLTTPTSEQITPENEGKTADLEGLDAISPTDKGSLTVASKEENIANGWLYPKDKKKAAYTEKGAKFTLKAKGLTDTHEAVEVEGGWAIKPKDELDSRMEEVIPEAKLSTDTGLGLTEDDIAEAVDTVRQIAGNNVRVEGVDSIEADTADPSAKQSLQEQGVGEGDEFAVAGTYVPSDGMESVITLSMRDGKKTTHLHEVMHHILRLISPKKKAFLLKKFGNEENIADDYAGRIDKILKRGPVGVTEKIFSHISEILESLKNLTTAKGWNSERKIAREVAEGKYADKTANPTDGTKLSVSKEEFKENLAKPVMTPLKGAVEHLKWITEKTAPTHMYKLVPKSQREAIRGYINKAERVFRGHAGERNRAMTELTASLEEAKRYLDKNGELARTASDYYEVNGSKGLAEHITDAGFTPEQGKWVETYFSKLHSPMSDKLFDVINKFKDVKAVANYLSHIYKDPAKADKILQNIFSKQNWEGNKFWSKKRTKDTLKQAEEENGLERASDNPVRILLAYAHSVRQFEMANEIFRDLRDQGVLFTGKEAAELDPELQKLLKPIDDRIAQKWVPVLYEYKRKNEAKGVEKGDKKKIGEIKIGQLYAPTGVADMLNNTMGGNMLSGPLSQGLNRANAALNSAQLGLSTFHGAFITALNGVNDLATAWRAASRGDFKQAGKLAGKAAMFPVSTVSAFKHGRKIAEAYRNPEAYANADKDTRAIVDALTAANGRVKMDDIYRVLSEDDNIHTIVKNFKNGNYFGGAAKGLALGLQKTMAPIMEHLVPMVKLHAFSTIYQEELAQHPDADANKQADLAQYAWDRAEDRMGQMTYENLFWDKTFKTAMHLALRSVGWNLGDTREFGGAATDTASALKAIKEGKFSGKEHLTQKMGFVFGLTVLTAYMGAIMTFLMTGEPPEELIDYFAPKTGKELPNGSDERISLPTYFRDLVALGRQGVKTTAMHKMSPLAAMLGEYVKGEDYFGEELVSPDSNAAEQLVEYGRWAAKHGMPFSVQGAMKAYKDTGDYDGVLLSLLGFTPAPRYITQDEAQQLIEDRMRLRFGGTRSHKQVLKSRVLSDIEKDYRKNKKWDTRKLEEAKMKGYIRDIDRFTKTREQFSPDLRRFGMFTPEDQVALFEKFKKKGLDDAIKRYTVKLKPAARKELGLPQKEKKPRKRRTTRTSTSKPVVFKGVFAK